MSFSYDKSNIKLLTAVNSLQFILDCVFVLIYIYIYIYIYVNVCTCVYISFLGGSVVKNPPANVGSAGLILGSGRSPGEGNGNPL